MPISVKYILWSTCVLSIKIARLAELKGLSVSSISQSVSYLVTQRMLPDYFAHTLGWEHR